MVQAATLTRGNPITPNSGQAQPGPAASYVPFTRAAKEHEETFDDRTIVLSNAAAQTVGPIDIVAYGYMRGLQLLVEFTAGTNVAGTVHEDAPWSLFQNIQIADVNGAPILGPLSGYDVYALNKYGGIRMGVADPKANPAFVTPTIALVGGFVLRLPIEHITRTALGSLANQNSSSAFKLSYTINPTTSLVTGQAFSVQPSVRIRAQLEAWTQPPEFDLTGRPNATEPDNHGTTFFWSGTNIIAPVGTSSQRLNRVGNYIRELIVINRDNGTGLRAANGEGGMPDPWSLYYDTRLLVAQPKKIVRTRMHERLGFTTTTFEGVNGPDNGVVVFDYCHEFDMKYGNELCDGYLPTVQATRLELQGTWTTSANVRILTNDVAPRGNIFDN